MKKTLCCSCPSEDQLPSPYCTMFQEESDRIKQCYCYDCHYLKEVENDG